MARIAFIVDDLYEDSELRVPYENLRQEGHEVVVVGREANKEYQGKKGKDRVRSDTSIRDVSSGDFDALVIPGGYAPDKLRTDPSMVALVRNLFDAGKPVAAICHAGWVLAEAGVVDGRTVTSWPSIKTDLVNAGANWVDREVVEDGNLITSRGPQDLDPFCQAISRQIQGRIPERLTPSREAGAGPAEAPVH
jgi:protease I